jgi:hypothetical protein
MWSPFCIIYVVVEVPSTSRERVSLDGLITHVEHVGVLQISNKRSNMTQAVLRGNLGLPLHGGTMAGTTLKGGVDVSLARVLGHIG